MTPEEMMAYPMFKIKSPKTAFSDSPEAGRHHTQVKDSRETIEKLKKFNLK